MSLIPYDPQAYQLLHEGTLALAQVEANGMRLDVDYLKEAIRRTEIKINHMESRLESSDVYETWSHTFRDGMNLNSSEQLGKVLFDVMKFPAPEITEGGKYKTDEEALAKVDHPFVKDLLEIRKLQKASGTYLKGLLREQVDGFIHPFFNLHLALTYRSSSEAPNFQNIPVRDKLIKRLVRRAFIAREGRQLGEIDISGAEVRVAACYHKDPTMIDYILDPSKDMHRDMAQECFLLSKDEIGSTKSDPGKTIRYCGKNMFVFPQFYGDWYQDCARSLWEAIEKFGLKTAQGVPLRQHLAEKGYKSLGALDPQQQPNPGTFELLLQKVERNFWEKRFPTYNLWKKDWFEAYRKLGYFKTLTGFICQGFMKRNEAINYPVQGSAFHCLLWSLIRLLRYELPRRKMQTVIVGQIHDSIVADIVPSERDEFLGLVYEVMTKLLQKHWPWLIVPLEIEAEVAPVGGSWADKEEVKIHA